MKEIVRLCILVACVMTIIGIDCMCLFIGYMYLLQMSIISYKCLCVYDYTGSLVTN